MNKLTVDQDCNCSVTITSKYAVDAMSVDILTNYKHELYAVIYTPPGEIPTFTIHLGEDGLFELTRLYIPTVEWYEKELKFRHNKLYKYELIYVTDGKHIYLVVDGEYVEIDPLFFTFNGNTTYVDNVKYDLSKSTIYKYRLPFFFMCYLWKCYIHFCEEILANIKNYNIDELLECSNCGLDLKDLIYARDFLWASINVINYLVDDGQLDKAQEILLKILSCKGFCFGIDGRLNITPEWTDYVDKNSTGVLLNSGCNCN